VNAQRIDVLHVAHRDAVVKAVAHNLVLDFLPAFDGLVDQDLVGHGKGRGGQSDQLVLVVGEAGAEAAESEGGANKQRVADLFGGFDGAFQSGRRAAWGHLLELY